MASVPYPGVTRVLSEASRTGLGSLFNISWENPLADMERVEKMRKDEVLLLGGYAEPYEYFFNAGTERVGVLWTSPPLQSELTPIEYVYLSRLKAHLDGGRLHFIWFGNREWVDRLNWPNTFYAPYPASVPTFDDQPDLPAKKPPLQGHNVGFFGPLNGRKNVLTQMLAAKELDATLHISDLKPEYEVLARTLKVDVINHRWGTWNEYIRTVSQMHGGLQVSLRNAESFSYVCFDHLSVGVPCLTSVDWAPPDIKVEDPLDVGEIVYKLRSVLQNPPLPMATKAFAEYVAKTQTESFMKAIRPVVE